MDTELLSTDQLASRWNMSRGHLSNLRSEGRSPIGYVKVGSRVAYRLADVLAYEDTSYVAVSA